MTSETDSGASGAADEQAQTMELLDIDRAECLRLVASLSFGRLVADIVAAVREFGIAPLVTDPLADPAEAEHEYGIELVPLEDFTDLDGLILAVPHQVLGEAGWDTLFAALTPGGVFVDVKSAVARDKVPRDVQYWSL